MIASLIQYPVEPQDGAPLHPLVVPLSVRTSYHEFLSVAPVHVPKQAVKCNRVRSAISFLLSVTNEVPTQLTSQRLSLNVDTWTSREFRPNTIPPYAVASPQWLVPTTINWEATYEEVVTRRNTHTDGYKQIEAFRTTFRQWRHKPPNIRWLCLDWI